MVVAGQPKTHERVHPGDQPRRSRASRARAHGLQLGAPARPVALRDVQPLPPHALPAGRGAVGDAVRAARARPRPDRRARVAAAALRAGLEPQPRRRACRSCGRWSRSDARETIRARADDQIGQQAADALAQRIERPLGGVEERRRQVGQRTLVYQRRGKSEPTCRCCRSPGSRAGATGRCRRRCATSRPRCRSSCARHGISARDGGLGAAPERSAPLPTPKDAERHESRASHVGELRPSQLLHTYGVGATVELPELTTLVLGLDDWPQVLGEPVSEPRLLAAVRAAVGPQVEQLLTPPVVPEGESAGVPVAPFPRWLRCPLCSLLAPIDHGVFAAARRPVAPRAHHVRPRGLPEEPGRAPADRVPGALPDGLPERPPRRLPVGRVPARQRPLQGHPAAGRARRGGRAGDVQLSVRRVRATTPAVAGVRRGRRAVPAAALPRTPPAPRDQRVTASRSRSR